MTSGSKRKIHEYFNECSICTYMNEYNVNICIVCGNYTSIAAKTDIVKNECKVCTLKNDAGVTVCILCSAPLSTLATSLLQDKIVYDITNDIGGVTMFYFVFHNFLLDSNLIPLLEKCLRSGIEKKTSFALSSFIEHYSQRQISETNLKGDTWTCGYRNILMMLSSLSLSPYHAPFSEYSLDVFSIQKIIEQAWKSGFDSEVKCRRYIDLLFYALQGRNQLNGKLIGTNKWIGATGM